MEKSRNAGDSNACKTYNDSQLNQRGITMALIQPISIHNPKYSNQNSIIIRCDIKCSLVFMLIKANEQWKDIESFDMLLCIDEQNQIDRHSFWVRVFIVDIIVISFFFLCFAELIYWVTWNSWSVYFQIIPSKHSPKLAKTRTLVFIW